MPFPVIPNVPHLTRAQMTEVDRLMIDDLGISLTQMMENAGRALAILARERFLGGDVSDKSVLVMAGSGGNGGGAMVAARRLANWGAKVHVVLSHDLSRLSKIPRHQHGILQKMNLPITQATIPDQHFDLIIDGLIGYSLNGAPRGAGADLIRFANNHPAPILALDTPSGLDVTSAQIHDPTISAAATLTLALPKTGLVGPNVKTQVGDLYCADISVPPSVYARAGLKPAVPDLFNHSDIIRIL